VSLAAAAPPAQVATDRVQAAVSAPAIAPGGGGAAGGGNGALAAVPANCSHISADAALRNAQASYASTGALPLGDSWCASLTGYQCTRVCSVLSVERVYTCVRS